MTLLETHAPGRPSRVPEPISQRKALELMTEAGIGVGATTALIKGAKTKGEEGDADGDPMGGDVALAP